MIERTENVRKSLAESNEEMLFSDGFDEALTGVCYQFGRPPTATYDYDKCIAILVEGDGMTRIEAIEFFEFNVSGSYVGDSTPVFVEQLTED